MTKLVVGCGYLGQRVAERWLASGHDVYAVTRNTERADRWRAEGLYPIVADVTDGQSLAELPAVETVLFAVGFDRASDSTIQDVYVAGLRRVLDALPSQDVDRFVYVSSTGVYGQTNAEVIDESAACRPVREGGRACLAAEGVLTQHELGDRAIILRLAGIYGPGRIPRLAELRSGQPIGIPAATYLNLIHVDDAARLIAQSLDQSELPALLNVSDGHPVERRDYFREIARQLGVDPPMFVDPEPGSPVAQRARSSKRISHEKLVRELNFRFGYPSFREGLAQALAEHSH